jgi:XRE family transcriptional regulator, regulator of sulfur utilization
MKPSFNLEDRLAKNAEKQAFAAAAGERLRKFRKQTGISQEELSEKAGYYRTYVGHVESGRYSPSLHTMWRFAHVLGVDLGELLKGL